MKLALFCRRLAPALALILLLSLAGCSPIQTAPNQSVPRPAAGKALVIFYREDHILGSSVEYKIRDENVGPKAIGGLRSGSWFAYQCDPGQHVFQASTEVMEIAVLHNAAAGRTYYIRGGIHPGVVIWRPDLRFVSAAEGRDAIRSLRKVELVPRKSQE